MRSMFAIALAAGMALSMGTPAEARQGCGPGGHRGPYGHCRPNRGPGYGHRVLIVDRYYPGRGYWDGQRYWHHRERLHNRWHYR